DLGARPLKRAIDQYVAAPLAATIVERRFPEGDQFVFVRRDGQALSAEFVDPDADDDNWPAISTPPPTARDLPELKDIIRGPTGDAAEVHALSLAHQRIVGNIETTSWEQSKAELAHKMGMPEFWSRPDRFETLSKYELMDRLEAAADTANSLGERLKRSVDNNHRSARELSSRLALQLHLLDNGLTDLNIAAPVDATIVVEPAMSDGDDGAAIDWCGEIRAMYEAWARKRNMRIDTVEEVVAGGGSLYVIAGFGAFRTLEREAGLHVLEESENGSGPHRVTARVIVVSTPPDTGSKAALKTALQTAIKSAPRSTFVVRRYRRGASPLVRNADGSWRIGRLNEILGGDFDLYI
ncbi:MAG: PCRF domain-containing protein, partial [Proteobacteria bacterium]|nr:PCRF domain-containing protein [Pseudomonadota bacterium]